MRIASRVIGAVLAVAGLAFLALCFLALTGSFDRRSVLADGSADPLERAAGMCAAIGIALILAAWYYLRSDADGDDSRTAPSRTDRYLAAHRRKLEVLAEAGLAISAARLGAVGIGIDWPGEWAGWAIGWLSVALAFMGLQSVGGPDWNALAEPRRPVVKTLFRAGQVAFFILTVRFAWNQWHHQFSSPVLECGLSALLFGWAAMTFAHPKIEVPKNATEIQRDG